MHRPLRLRIEMNQLHCTSIGLARMVFPAMGAVHVAPTMKPACGYMVEVEH